MDLNVLSRGRHRLKSLSPLEYCWVASNFASALHKDPNFNPSDNEIMSMLFMGYLDRFHFRINYTSVWLCCLIFSGDNLLLFRPTHRGDRKHHCSTARPEDIFEDITDPRPLDQLWNIPNFVTARLQSSLAFDAERPGSRIQTSIEFAFWEWAERIVDFRNSLHYARPSVVYHTIADESRGLQRQADRHCIAVIAGIFHYSEELGKSKSTEQDKYWDHDAFYYDGRHIEDDSMVARWADEDLAKGMDWVDDRTKQIALAAFKARKGEDIGKDGYQTGRMFCEP